MTDGNRLPRLKLMVTIIDRDKGALAVSLFRAHHLHFDYLCMGLGTASSRILDYFGRSETEKDVVFTLVPEPCVGKILRLTAEKFQIHRPGQGILFTVPLSAVSAQVPQVLCKKEYLAEDGAEEAENMEHTKQYTLILAVVNHGSVDAVMDAARSEGARGGTVLYARRVGMEDMENVLGFTFQPEKEVVAILAPKTQKKALMEAINRSAGLTTEARGILFALPVDDLIGLQPPIDNGAGQE